MKNVLLILSLFIALNAQSALDKTQCSTAVINELKKTNPQVDSAQYKAMWEAICKGLIDHITSSAKVTGPINNNQLENGVIE